MESLDGNIIMHEKDIKDLSEDYEWMEPAENNTYGMIILVRSRTHINHQPFLGNGRYRG